MKILEFIKILYRILWNFPRNWKPYGWKATEMSWNYWRGKKLYSAEKEYKKKKEEIITCKPCIYLGICKGIVGEHNCQNLTLKSEQKINKVLQ